MFNAPTLAGLTGTRATIADGYPGIVQTLRQMRALVNQYRVDPLIRQCAIGLIFLTPEKNQLSEVDAIFSSVRDSIRYVRDIVDVETLATPIITLASQAGDCDDQVVLLSTLVESVGYPTRFVIAGYHDPAIFEHVYLQILIGNEWVNADPTEHYPLGWFAPDFVCLKIEGE